MNPLAAYTPYLNQLGITDPIMIKQILEQQLGQAGLLSYLQGQTGQLPGMGEQEALLAQLGLLGGQQLDMQNLLNMAVGMNP